MAGRDDRDPFSKILSKDKDLQSNFVILLAILILVNKLLCIGWFLNCLLSPKLLALLRKRRSSRCGRKFTEEGRQLEHFDLKYWSGCESYLS